MIRSVARFGLAAVAAVLALAPAQSADPKTGKARLVPGKVEVEAVTNDAWKVSVRVDSPDASYAVNDEVAITVSTDKGGYLYVFSVDDAGTIACLFPNQYQMKNEVPAGATVTIPDPGNKTFRFRADKAGKELIKAVVTSESLAEVNLKEFTSRAVTPVTKRKFVRLATELVGGDPNGVPTDPVSTNPDQDGKKPEVVIQKEKVQKQNPDVYVKKQKEWATGEVEISVTVGKVKPDQGKPVIEKPVIEKPVIEKPVIEKPVIEKPVIEKPVIEKPVVEKPIQTPVQTPVQKPVIEKPIQNPVIEKPVVKPIQNPVIEKPVVTKPDQTPVQKPVIEKPVVKPIQNPVIEKPVQNPVIEKPVVKPIQTPVIEKPVVTKPDQTPVQKPVIDKPVIVKPDQNPVVTKPDQKPVIVKPDQKPVVVKPDQKPVIEKPVIVKPVDKPVIEKP